MLLLVVGAGFAIVGVGPWRLVCGLERLVAKLGVAREREGPLGWISDTRFRRKARRAIWS